MANSSPAVVTELTGRAWIRNSDGSLTELHQGSKVPAGSDVVTASGATVALQVENGMPIVIGEGRQVAMNGDVSGALPDPTEAAVTPPRAPIPSACWRPCNPARTRLKSWIRPPPWSAAVLAMMAAAVSCAWPAS